MSHSSSELLLSLADISTGVEGEIQFCSGNDILIGREPTSGICVLDEGISRQHGRFLRLGRHWFYQDVGSTNGSYINGTELEVGVWHIVRDQDIVQLADICLRVREFCHGKEVSIEERLRRSRGVILVLKDNQLVGEIPVEEQGKLLVIGGMAASDFELSDDDFHLPALVVEHLDKQLFVYGLNSKIVPVRFGYPLSGKTQLESRQSITLENYTVIFEKKLDPVDASKIADQFSWVNKKSIRKTPVRLVELRPTVSSTVSGLLDVEDDDITTTREVVSSRALALMTSAVTTTALKKESELPSINPRDRASQRKKIERQIISIIDQIKDTASVIAGILGVFIILLCLGLLTALIRGDDIKILVGF